MKNIIKSLLFLPLFLFANFAEYNIAKDSPFITMLNTLSYILIPVGLFMIIIGVKDFGKDKSKQKPDDNPLFMISVGFILLFNMIIVKFLFGIE